MSHPRRPYGMSSLSVSEPLIEDCACPDGAKQCCGLCPGSRAEPCCLPDAPEDDK